MNTLDGTRAAALVEPVLTPRIEVIRATTGPEFDAVLEIRRRVFSDEQGMVDGRVNDQDDSRSIQALALWHEPDRVLPVGTGRVTLGAGERGEALISWVATLPNARRLGVGREVMGFLVDQAEWAGAPVIALAAQMHAELFYRKLGFIGTGRTYRVRGVEHRWMVKRNHRQVMQHGS